MPKALVVIEKTLTNLVTVIAGGFDPKKFFKDLSQYDLMKLAVQLGRDGEITVERVMEYVKRSFAVDGSDAEVYAIKLFVMLQKLSVDCQLPFASLGEPDLKSSSDNGGRGEGARKQKDSPLQKFITACGDDESVAKKKLTQAIRKAGKNGAFGAVGRAFEALAKEPGFKFLAGIPATARTYIISHLGVDSKKVLAGKR